MASLLEADLPAHAFGGKERVQIEPVKLFLDLTSHSAIPAPPHMPTGLHYSYSGNYKRQKYIYFDIFFMTILKKGLLPLLR